MNQSNDDEHDWHRFGQRICAEIGIKYDADRIGDLRRRVEPISRTLGFDTPSKVAKGMIGSTTWSQQQVAALASVLTIGETYFFRDGKLFDLLEERLLPDLISQICIKKPQVNIWSAASCTGEEPYTVAMLLAKNEKFIAQHCVKIHATDLNPQFLEAARRGVYGTWSLRSLSADYLKKYFTPKDETKQELSAEIRSRVTFSQLNLVDDKAVQAYAAGTSFDIIFCRNVLIYFTQEQTQAVINSLWRRLAENGLLILSPHDVWCASDTMFEKLIYPSVVILRKKSGAVTPKPSAVYTPTASELDIKPLRIETARKDLNEQPPLPPDPLAKAKALIQQGRYQQAITLLQPLTEQKLNQADVFQLLAVARANSGDFSEAIGCIGAAIQADPLDAYSYYLKAEFHQETQDLQAALTSLRQATFLDPQFILAHLGIASILSKTGKTEQANVSYNNVLRLLKSLSEQDFVPHSDGLTAGKLAEIIKTRRTAQNG